MNSNRFLGFKSKKSDTLDSICFSVIDLIKGRVEDPNENIHPDMKNKPEHPRSDLFYHGQEDAAKEMNKKQSINNVSFKS